MAEPAIRLTMPVHFGGAIYCTASGNRFQRVTVSLPAGDVVFAGANDGPLITNEAAGSTYAASVPAAAADIPFSIRWDVSAESPDGPFQSGHVEPSAAIVDSGLFTTIKISSDDIASGNGFSLTIVLLTAKQTTAPSDTGDVHAPLDWGRLDLHAKTYYNAPAISGGDEHYITALYDSTNNGRARWSGTGWQFASGGWADAETPLGGYLSVGILLDNPVYPSLSGATLYLFGTTSYWLSRPTGHRSVSWTATLSGTTYVVNRVTN